MASSPDINLKEKLNISFKDIITLNPLCRNIAFGMFTYNYCNYF